MTDDPPRRSLLFAVLFVIAGLALHARIGIESERSRGLDRLADTDSYTRLLRVEDLRQGAPWHAEVTPKLNAPQGLSLHWTRPLDLMILGPAWVLEQAGTPPHRALHLAGAAICPLLHILCALLAAWAARGLWGGMEPWFAALLIYATPLVTAYSSWGRADHHTLILMGGLVGLGGLLRALRRPEAGARAAAIGGAGFGAGIWVSPEVLLFAGPALAGVGLAWVLAGEGRPVARIGRIAALGMLAGTALGVAVERPPGDWLLGEYDKVSVQHVAMAALAAMVFAAAERFGGRARLARLGIGAGLGGAAVALLLAAWPGALSGSLSGADPVSAAEFLPGVAEMQPIRLLGPAGWVEGVAYAWGFVLGLLALALGLPAMRRDGRWRGALPLLLVLLATFGATLLHRRFAADLGAPAAIAAAGLPGLVLARLAGGWMVARAAAVALAVLLVLAPPFLALPALPETRQDLTGRCEARDLAPWLAEMRPGITPATPAPVLLNENLNHGPELAWRTPYRLVAAPYHRGGDAFRDTRAILSQPPDAARPVLAARQAALLLVCVQTRMRQAPPPEGSLEALLRAGAPPDWLAPVALPPDLAARFLLFRVLPDRG
jgi:hypothetical protein